MYRIVYTKRAVKDIKYLKRAKLDEKAKKLIEIVRNDPFQNPPAYEKLVGNLSGAYSRRINIQHRFVYQVIEETCTHENICYDGTIKILSMWSHYEKI